MKMNVTRKITIIATIIVFLSVSALSFMNYRSSYREVLQAAGVELTGCANITTGIIDSEALFELVNGNEDRLNQIEEEIEWTVIQKEIFETHYILSLDGKVLAADSNLKAQGFSASDEFFLPDEAIEHILSGHTYYTEVYEFGGMKRLTGYAPIFKDHNPKNEVIAINAIDFEGSIVIERTWQMVKPTLIIGILLPIVAAVVTSLFVRRTIKPIQAISKHVNLVSLGKLNLEPLNINTKDELGQLARDVNEMVDSLKILIQEVVENSEVILATSEELFARADDTNHSTERIHDAISELATGVEKQSLSTETANQNLNNMAQSIQNISSEINELSQALQNADQIAYSGQEIVKETMEQMDKINENTNEMNQISKRLNEQSKEIDQIINLITSISEQTNLLALNASIEAARAGEHGKGFSVVANEVGKLAEQTSVAVDEVAQLVNEIQKETQVSLEKTNQGYQSVSQGNKLIALTTESFDKISKTTTQNAEQLTHLLEEIDLIREQVNGLVLEVNEITAIAQHSAKNTSQINQSGEEQTIMMQDIYAASKELATIAEKLHLSIERFES
ncbi:MAG: methyl-accepting chemotaxis protein [Amphibacillus sp.]|nr:methyl-accepting chemotaxis protein [Amphibacillus sp.]